MREEHPIDERFSTLYGAESTPPDAVRTALGARLGWSTTPTAWGLWRPWLIAASSAIVAGLLIHFVWQGPGQTGAEQSTEVKPNEEITSSALTDVIKEDVNLDPESADGTSLQPQRSDRAVSTTTAIIENVQNIDTRSTDFKEGQPAQASAFVSATSHKRPVPTGTQDRSLAEESSAMTAYPAAPVAAVQEQSALGEHKSEVDGPGRVASGEDLALLSNSVNVSGSGVRTSFLRDEASVPMLLRPAMMDPIIEAGTPVSDNRKVPYVLPRGTWWVAPYVSMGPVRGQWKGNGANDLSDAENWRSSAQGGLLAGRTWQSGWSVSAGVGLSRIRSSFAYSGANGTEEYTEVDTMWTPTPYADTPYTLYTWTIDSLVGTRPGATVQRDSRNQYTAVQVPLTLSWHTAIRRFQYGAFGGISAWIPTKRSGLTLVRPAPDALPSVADLSDPNTDARIQAQIHGRLGLSVGYSISEFLGIYAEPMVSTPLMVFDKEASPRLTQPAIQLRLQYEFPSTR